MLDSNELDEAYSMKCAYADKDTPLDTNFSSLFWRASFPVIAERDLYGRLITECKTEIRSRWTQTNLYLLFICPYHKLYLKPAPDIGRETYGL